MLSGFNFDHHGNESDHETQLQCHPASQRHKPPLVDTGHFASSSKRYVLPKII